MTQGQEKNLLKGLEETVQTFHAGLEIGLLPTRQAEKP